jgi:sucrose phosphorylase
MMSMQGIPAFYINSLSGTPNDYEGVAETGALRSINRKHWHEDELNTILSSDTIHNRIFNELIRLMGIRRQCPVFHPDYPQRIWYPDDRLFAFDRLNPVTGERILCISNLSNHPVEIEGKKLEMGKGFDLISSESLPRLPGHILFNAYQTRWITVQNN